MRRYPLLALTTPVALVAALACGGAEPEGAPDAAPADTVAPASDAAPAAAAPLDSVTAWARDIREGIAPLPARAATDPAAARQRAVELYVTRQERIEQAAGPGTGAPEALAEAVHEAEAAFHALMQLLGETPPPDSTRVAEAVGTLDGRVGEVVDLAGRTDVAADGADAP